MDIIEITTMCAVFNNEKDKVLFINRKKDWKGFAFPGGHLENGESIQNCIIREVFEETGLKLKIVKFVGITHFYNNLSNRRYMVHNFVSNCYEGDSIKECEEGEIVWVDKENVHSLKFAEGMDLRLDLFFEDGLRELFIEWNEIDGYLKIEKCDL